MVEKGRRGEGEDSVSAGHAHHHASISHLVHPVRVKDAKSADLSSHSLLGNAPQVPRGLELRDTLARWLSIDDTLVKRASVIVR